MSAPHAASTRPLRVMIAHNRYQHRGGEDVVVEAESNLLRQHGHEVLLYERHNDELAAGNVGKLGLLRDTLWSRRSAAQLSELFAQFRPDVLHVHNTLPLISPAIYWAAARAQVPVVQTLHNFRLLCPQGLMLREQQVCEDCLGRPPWPAVRHACYRGSTAQSAAVAATVQLHRSLGTWRDKITLYIALNEFCRDKFVQGGLPGERIRIKPNFCISPGHCEVPRRGFLYVGRLAPEKGVHTLAAATRLLPSGLTISLAGSGPEEDAMRNLPAIEMLGLLPKDRIDAEMARSCALIVPSVCPEMFGLVVIEAFASGLPVIASRIGALANLVQDGVTGLLANPGDPADLARCIAWAHSHPDELLRMGKRARSEFEQRYTPARNAAQMIELYREAMALNQAATR